MTADDARRKAVDYWMFKATEALLSAHSELQADRLDFAVNRAYYACFYAASAVLLRMGKEFVKHSGLRGAVHRDLVKTGLLEPRWGKVFDRTFDNRQSGDYLAMWEFEREHAERLVYEAEGFVKEIDRLLGDPRADGESAGARARHEP